MCSTTMHTLEDLANHVQVQIYGASGEAWDIMMDEGMIWPTLHVPKNQQLWKVVSFIKKDM